MNTRLYDELFSILSDTNDNVNLLKIFIARLYYQDIDIDLNEPHPVSGFTPIQTVTMNGNSNLFNYLVFDQSVNLDASHQSFNALDYATLKLSNDIFSIIFKDQLTEKFCDGTLPLHVYAACGKDREIQSFLDQHHAEDINILVNIKTVHGKSPLFYALATHNHATAALLRQYGAEELSALELLDLGCCYRSHAVSSENNLAATNLYAQSVKFYKMAIKKRLVENPDSPDLINYYRNYAECLVAAARTQRNIAHAIQDTDINLALVKMEQAIKYEKKAVHIAKKIVKRFAHATMEDKVNVLTHKANLESLLADHALLKIRSEPKSSTLLTQQSLSHRKQNSQYINQQLAYFKNLVRAQNKKIYSLHQDLALYQTALRLKSKPVPVRSNAANLGINGVFAFNKVDMETQTEEALSNMQKKRKLV